MYFKLYWTERMLLCFLFESASGDHPIESVKTLRLVSEFAEHVKKDGPFAMKDVLELLHKSL